LALIHGTPWLVLLAAIAPALRAVGAVQRHRGLMALSDGFARHGGPTGVIGMLAFFGAGYAWGTAVSWAPHSSQARRERLGPLRPLLAREAV